MSLKTVWSILIFPALVSVAVLAFTPYTEIDWRTYLQQVDQIKAGSRNYLEISGDTGPIVYPAGHVYLYWILSWLTGSSVFCGQLVFAGFYMVTCYLVVSTGLLAGVPGYVLLWSTLSRRTISVFVLRLFNDAPCTMFVHASVYYLMRRRWTLGCVFFSLAVSIKMSALLFAPGVLFVLLQNIGRQRAAKLIVFVCGGIQLVLGLPFLVSHPKAYLMKAFELSRRFEQKWSVNYQFLSAHVFESPYFSIALLLLTVATYYWFSTRVWSSSILTTLYLSNFIGIVFARTLHYQFYAWYAFTLPVLAYSAVWTKIPAVDWTIRVAILLGIELCFNYPSVGDNPATPASSFLLHVLHATLLLPYVFSRK